MMNTGKEFKFFMDVANKMFMHRIEKEFLEEIQGIADGTAAAGFEIPLDGLLAWNGYIELLYNWWPTSNSESIKIKWLLKQIIAVLLSLQVMQPKIMKQYWVIIPGGIFIVGQYFNIILDINPSDGYRLFMQSVPGYIHSTVDFFITGGGIIGASTTICGFNEYDEEGEPEYSRVRRAMQYGNGIDQWVLLMQKNNNGGAANSWLLGDINTNEIA